MVPEDLKFTKEHEWVRVEGDIAVVGVTDFAQSELGDVVYVELSQIGDDIAQSESMGTIEAVKAVSDIFAPVSGEIVEINEELESVPESINKDPFGEGWLAKIRISDKKELDNLLTPEKYKELIGE